jgi:hypothetical protein
VAENCDGTTNDCPADAFLPATTDCRPAAGVCDVAEFCTGTTATCPADGVKPSSAVCRPAADICDLAENCDGTTTACPADAKEPNTFVCRPAVGVCDLAESCDGSSNSCPADQKKADNTSCSDGVFCNGAETCQSGNCTSGSNPCPSQICDEGTAMCLATTCPAAPESGCRTAAKSLLLIKKKTGDASKDKLIWKFIKGQSTSFDDLSDPTQTADYALCVYAGAGNTLVGAVNISPSSTLWSAVGTQKGYKYSDPSFASDGVQKVIVKAGGDGKTKELLKARGAALPDILGMMGLGNVSVTAQLVNHGSGVCWQGDYPTPTKSTDTQFKAEQ